MKTMSCSFRAISQYSLHRWMLKITWLVFPLGGDVLSRARSIVTRLRSQLISVGNLHIFFGKLLNYVADMLPDADVFCTRLLCSRSWSLLPDAHNCVSSISDLRISKVISRSFLRHAWKENIVSFWLILLK